MEGRSGKLSRTALGLLALLSWPSASFGQMSATWTQAFAPVAVADNLYYVGSAGLGAFLLTSEDGHILVDAPLQENVPLVLQNIRSLGFDPADIRVHVVTHAHYDHVAGLADLMRETGGELLVSREDAPFVTEGRDFGFASEGYPPARVDRTLRHLETVQLGSVELTAHVTPGHTPGCTSWTGRVTIEGRIQRFLLVCSLSALDVYRLGGDDPTYEGQATDFCTSVAHLRTLDPDIFLSNHGGFFGLAEKAQKRRAGDAFAFVDPTEHDRFLDRAAQAIDGARQAQGLEVCP